ncbi:putative ABC transport system permease protein [Nitrospirillum amazonense]|uniref:Putative ABC transport system permease protein n=1 Tax=Nitrospirillum amazonense TaxID=28077 RepID=A0A560FT86_9PROT|nr:ABC transporter permease [Nitrospirillum amazonense]TWB24854.1 putative ABC transport system permease protein [Nitrospirillum amazonense]
MPMFTLPVFLRRHILFTLLNLTGLAVGIAAFLLVSLYVAEEGTVDRGFTHADRLYRVGSQLNVGGQSIKLTFAPDDLAGSVKQEVPEVEAVTRIEQDRVMLGAATRYFEQRVLWADPDFLRLLDYPLERGDPALALARPDGVVVTRDLARTLFGDADPMGRTIEVRHGPALTVTGILAPLGQSHLVFTAIAAEAARGDKSWAHAKPRPWSDISGVTTYVRLAPGASAAAVGAGLPAFVNRHNPPNPDKAGGGMDNMVSLRLDPVPDIYLRVKALGALAEGDVGTLQVLGGVALLILGIAIANYTNMATAQAITRAREVGIRKLVGARRRQLVALFTGEAVLLAAVGTVAALALMELARPAFQGLVGRDVSLAPLTRGWLLPLLLATPVLVGVLGGFYPALVLSGYRPGEVLKGRAQAPGAGRVRAVLVVAQFAVSIALMVATFTVQRQVAHVQAAGLGYQPDSLYLVSNLPADLSRAATLKAEVTRLPGVRAASLSSLVPAAQSESLSSFDLPENTRSTLRQARGIATFTADQDFFATYGARLVAGKDLPPGWKPAEGDEEKPRYLILTETAARRMGYTRPEDAVGERLSINSEDPTEVAGVVADMRFQSARRADLPLMFPIKASGEHLTVRLAAGDQRATMAAVNAVVDKLYPDADYLRRAFADERIESLYQSERRQARVFAAFGGLAVALANMGLFGLTALTAARRTKEIGVRRVVGAKVPDIMGLMAWQFTRPVLLANLVAWPVAWWALHQWLLQFTVRVDQAPLTFLAAGAVALAVALATVAVHVIRVASAPPVAALRYE